MQGESPSKTFSPSEYYVPFHESMRYTTDHGDWWNNGDRLQDHLWRTLYERNALNRAVPAETPKTPKIIHQIWLGEPLPQKYKKWQRTWQELHPDWEYKLWTEADLEEFGLENRALFDAVKQLGIKADIWRYEILYRHGGLYADMDFECLLPFDVLHHSYDFFAGIENTGGFQIGNFLIGARPGHPVLRACIDDIAQVKPTQYGTGETYSITGPPCLTRALIAYAKHEHDDCVIAMPTSYFNPAPLGFDGKFSSYTRAETFAVHHWAGAWTNS